MARSTLVILIFYFYFISQIEGQICGVQDCVQCDTNSLICTACNAGYNLDISQNRCEPSQTCEIGQYFDLQTKLCSNCHYSCESCYGPRLTFCYYCSQGFYFDHLYLSARLQCITCSVEFCKECNELDQCVTCFDGYRQINNVCEKCQVPFCNQCATDIRMCDECVKGYDFDEPSMTCLSNRLCKSGFYVDSSGNCVQCPDKSFYLCEGEICVGSGNNQCTQCYPGSYLSQNQCKPCSLSCKTCQRGNNHCTSCQNEFVLVGATCATFCQAGMYYDQNERRCQSCDKSCETCVANAKACLQCRDPIFYQKVGQLCLERCPQGQVVFLDTKDLEQWSASQFNRIDETDLKCIPCSENCVSCINKPEICTDCAQNLFLLDNQCVQMCPPGYFDYRNLVAGVSYCIKCLKPCNKCSDYYTCKQCATGFTLVENKCQLRSQEFFNGTCELGTLRAGDLCVQKCPNGMIESDTNCICDPTCIDCTYDYVYNNVICNKCKQQSHYDFQGVCFDQCPTGTFSHVSSDNRQLCFTSCPSQMKILIQDIDNKKSQECVLKCPDGTRSDGLNLCVKSLCQQGKFVLLSEYKQNSQDSSLFCKPCALGCSGCFGTLETQCYDCAPNYFRLSTTDGQDQFLKCAASCPDGMVVSSGSKDCQICRENCKVCYSTLYQYKNNCVQSCPWGTKLVGQLCQGQKKLIIQLDVDRMGTVIGYKNDIKINVFIFSDTNSTSNDSQAAQISCQFTSSNWRDIEIVVQTKDAQREMHSGIISAKYLSVGNTLEVTCACCTGSFVSPELVTTVKESFVGLPQGGFQISPLKGKSLETEFSGTIKKWKIDNVGSLIFNYQVYGIIQSEVLEENVRSQGNRQFLLFAANEVTNSDLLEKEEFQFSFKLPLIPLSSIDLDIMLVAYNLFSESITTIRLQLTSDSNQYDNVMTLFRNFTNYENLDLNDYQILGMSLALINRKDNEGPKIKNIESLQILLGIKYINIFPIGCVPQYDCSSQGSCRSQITNWFFKCQCLDEFRGHNCQWDEQQFLSIEAFVNQMLKYFQKLVKDKSETIVLTDFDVQDIMQVISEITNIFQIFDERKINRVFAIIDYIYINNMWNQDVLDLTLVVINNIFQILRVNDVLMRKEDQKLYTEKSENIVGIVVAKLSVGLNVRDYKLDLPNIKILLGNLDFLEIYNSDGVAEINVVQEKGSIFIAKFRRDTLPFNELRELYYKLIIWPIDVYEKKYTQEVIDKYENETQKVDLIISNIAEFSFNFQSTGEQFLPQLLPLNLSTVSSSSSLEKPQFISQAISIQIPWILKLSELDRMLKTDNFQVACLFWDGENEKWSETGLFIEKLSEDNSICYTSHLSHFALGVLELTPQINENLFNFTGWSTKNFEIGIINLVVFMLIAISTILINSKYGNQEQDGDEDRKREIEMKDKGPQMIIDGEDVGIKIDTVKMKIGEKEQQSGAKQQTDDRNTVSDNDILKKNGDQYKFARLKVLHSVFVFHAPLQKSSTSLRIILAFNQYTMYQFILVMSLSTTESGVVERNDVLWKVQGFFVSLILNWIFYYLEALVYFWFTCCFQKSGVTKQYLVLLGILIIKLFFMSIEFGNLIEVYNEIFYLPVLHFILDQLVIDWAYLILVSQLNFQRLCRLYSFKQNPWCGFRLSIK